MPERATSKAWLALAAGVLLALLAGVPEAALAAAAACLAQPALALGLRGTLPTGAALRRDLVALLLLWALAMAASALLVGWPLSALLASGGASLGAAFALSATAGLGVIALWRLWPLWQRVEGEGGQTLAGQWRSLDEVDGSSWRGLGAALAIAAILALALLLAWPGLVTGGARWILAALAGLAWPLLHRVLLRAPLAGAALDVVEMPEPAQSMQVDDADPGDATEALYTAARSGKVERALDLLEQDADPHALPGADSRDQRSLAVLAAVLPDLRLLRALIGRGVDLNIAHAGLTPLLAATRDSWHGRPEAVMTLLANGADPRAADRDGNTPLHHAARSSDPGVAALLRDAAAELDARNAEGVTPLGIACGSGNWRLARFLLERGARTEPEDGSPPLLAAAGGDDDDAAGVALLLRHKARVDARDARGRSALHEAALAGHVEIIGALLDARADPDARDSTGRTPLLDAAGGGHAAALDRLAAHADVQAVDGDGRNALHLASLCGSGGAALATRLLELGVDAGQPDASGKRAVDHAAAAGRWAVVAVLDPEHPLPTSVLGGDSDGPVDRPPLDVLREQLADGRHEGLEPLVQLVSPAELGGLLLDGDTPPTPARIEWLLLNGADPDARAEGADTALLQLLGRGTTALPAVQALLRGGASPTGAGGLARFLEACVREDQASRGLEQFALELVDRGADVFAPSPGGEPAAALSVRLGWMRLLERLVADGVDLDRRDGRGMTALHLAAALGREAALRLLVKGGASPAVRAADGQTPLGVALSAGRRDLADWLDWNGWALPGRPLREGDLPAAAMAGDAAAVRRLLDFGFAVDAVDDKGCTGLLRAAGGGHADVLELLLERGADPQRAAHTGATPLSAAVSMRHGAIVERLLRARVALEHRLPGDVTVLMIAAALGMPDICARLLTAGANIQAADAQGLTPLHCASLYGFTARDRPRLLALFDTLLLAGAEADAEAAGGVTPLLLLLGARAEPGTACDEDVVLAAVDRLLDEDTRLDAQDPRGFGPLHLTALHGLLRLARHLLRAGCDPGLRDALNRTPREVAVMRGFVDVAAEFAPAQGGVSMARFLRDRG
ncbi:ankyrin repeat domain-containing protein [Luteimonas sp. MC1750]|uniref:ankyrin repeat domain-containing protein n=1 Tax=Luteimonas sp. MC1750 TaxID=2799326 RepID=UPI0018F0E1B7|nr:ankyrin repeat domain-containing protein [Luteimonas sp. MC1750]MBJ6985069.1 ankyrin repeat domain-containing protein [Luteimonas sp. MC1750]QQO05731.1 ankyrin repeat domain-containing protein [Luteimonas sp. MC1750]